MDDNLQEIEDEIEALSSVFIQEINIEDTTGEYQTIIIDNEEEKVEIVKGFKIKIYPDDSVPAHMTKIMSKNSTSSGLGDNEHVELDQDQNVSIKICKVNYLPPLHLEVKIPSTYPSKSPPIFTLAECDFYQGSEELLKEKLLEMWEPGMTGIFEGQAYLQSGFVADYMQKRQITSLKCSVTNNESYKGIMSETRDAFKFKFAKEQKTCMICFEEDFGVNFFLFSSCSHYFCLRCLKAYCKSMIEDGNVTKIVCPDTTCKKPIIEEDIECLVNNEIFEKYKKFNLNNEVNSNENLTWCPIAECESIARIRGGNMFGECTECEFRFCLICQHFYHSGRRCPVLSIGANAFKSMNKAAQEKFIMDQLNDVYVKKYSKNCPSGNATITKLSGGNKMTCSSCGKYFCWICCKAITGYDHFKENPECWAAMGVDRSELSIQDVEEVKDNLKETDMSNAVVCPHGTNMTKKKSALNLLDCEHGNKQLGFYCGKKANEEHYIKNSCLKVSKVDIVIDVIKTIDGFTNAGSKK